MPLRIASLIAGLVALTAALTASFGTALSLISVSAPAELALGLGLLPSNAPLCLSTLITCVLGKWAYDWNVRLLRQTANMPLV